MAEPIRERSFEHPISKSGGADIRVLRIWLRRYVGQDVSVEVDDREKVFRFKAYDDLSLARASILIEQVAESGYPRRSFWTCQVMY